MRYLAALASLLLVIIMVTFVVLNSQQVVFSYYFGKVTIYLPLLLFIFLLFGVFLGMLSVIPSWWRGKRKLRNYKQQAAKFEKELNNLRSLPIKDMN